MDDIFIGQILLVSFPFAPRGCLHCNGELLEIRSNQALFALIGTRFGGDGVNHFAIPDLRATEPDGLIYVIATSGHFPDRP